MMMRLFFCLPTLLIVNLRIHAQATSAGILRSQEIQEVFNKEVRAKFAIEYPVRRVYSFSDKSGKFYTVLTEKNDSITGKDTLHYKIKAFHFLRSDNGLEKQWEINDFSHLKKDGSGETSIWFWTKYCSFEDKDKDGLTDPVIVYGTKGMNGIDDGRIKILTYFKGKKIAIRHQNGVLDNERNTQVDQAFYQLPASVQSRIKSIMMKIAADSNAIFPNGWEAGMKSKKTVIKE